MTSTLILATLLNSNQDLKATLTEGLQEEYMAHATYAAINKKFENKRPFANIVKAEAKHAQMFVQLFNVRKWEVPKDEFLQKKDESEIDYTKRLKIPANWTDALKLGLKIENEDVKFLSKALESNELPKDVKSTFERLLIVSRDHHAAAFKRALGINE